MIDVLSLPTIAAFLTALNQGVATEAAKAVTDGVVQVLRRCTGRTEPLPTGEEQVLATARILLDAARQDPELGSALLTWMGMTVAAPAATGPAPRRLPPLTSQFFVDRKPVLKALDREHGRRFGGRPRLVNLYGAAGIGLTSTAGHWAANHKGAFADGTLYVPLRGGRDAAAALRPVTVLQRVLQQLGLPVEQLRAERAVLAQAYQQAVARRRLLVVLDDVHAPAQVRDLVVAEDGVLTVLLSRTPLLGLCTPLQLGPLPDRYARRLLRDLAPSGAPKPSRTAERHQLARFQGSPWAMTVIGPALRAAPDSAAAQDAGAALDTEVLDAVHASLDEASARAYRLLALRPWPVITPALAAAVLGLRGADDADGSEGGGEGASEAAALLRELADRRLLTLVGDAPAAGTVSSPAVGPAPGNATGAASRSAPDSVTGRLPGSVSGSVPGPVVGPAPGSATGPVPGSVSRSVPGYVFRDHVQQHARRLAERTDRRVTRVAALRRAVEHLLVRAVDADFRAFPDRWHLGPWYEAARQAAEKAVPAAMPSKEAALDALRAMAGNLLEAVRAAEELDDGESAAYLCQTLWPLQLNAGLVAEVAPVLAAAVRLADRQLPDTALAARLHVQYALAQDKLGEPAEAERHLRTAAAYDEHCGHWRGVATALESLGLIRLADPRTHPEALTLFEQAEQAAARITADLDGHADLPRIRALLTRHRGRALRAEPLAARRVLEEARARFAALDRPDRYNEGKTLVDIAVTHVDEGALDRAVAVLDEAVALLEHEAAPVPLALARELRDSCLNSVSGSGA